MRNPQPYQKPVEKVELSGKHVGRRLFAAAVFLLIGVGAFAYFILNLVRGEPGWTEIKTLGSQRNCGDDFVFLYETGAGDDSAAAERHAVTAAYTAAAGDAYWMFENVRVSGGEDDDGDGTGGAGTASVTVAEEAAQAVNGAVSVAVVGMSAVADAVSVPIAEAPAANGAAPVAVTNEEAADGAAPMPAAHGMAAADAAGRGQPAAGSVRYLNDRPNQTVTVDGPLYRAFEKMLGTGRRELYLAPVYAIYESVFACTEDYQLAYIDPGQNEASAAFIRDALVYIKDPSAVNLELLGENQVRLSVSEDYLAFATENGIDSFIDFGWMKNAFITDYLADTLTEAGYTHGSISSFDGFVRNLDGRDQTYGFDFSDRVGEAVGQVQKLATLEYRGPASFVWLRDFMLGEQDRQHYYQTADGETRTSYIDLRDGSCRSAISSLLAYSYDGGVSCADILLSLLPVYIADEFDADAAETLADRTGGAIYSLYCQGDTIRANDPRAEMKDIYDGYRVNP